MISNFLWKLLDDMGLERMWFQQDDATCHAARETISWLRQSLPGRVISKKAAQILGIS